LIPPDTFPARSPVYDALRFINEESGDIAHVKTEIIRINSVLHIVFMTAGMLPIIY
jgi:hypothetical protein